MPAENAFIISSADGLMFTPLHRTADAADGLASDGRIVEAGKLASIALLGEHVRTLDPDGSAPQHPCEQIHSNRL
jgi:hypothetical protein